MTICNYNCAPRPTGCHSLQATFRTNDTERSQWASYGLLKKSELAKELITFVMYEINRLEMMPSYQKYYDLIESILNHWRVRHTFRCLYRDLNSTMWDS